MSASPSGTRRHGVIALIRRGRRWLVIRRSECVEAPGACCFAGGGVETGETEREALCREVAEELGVTGRPVRRVWESTTTWGIRLSWWLVAVPRAARIVPDPREVAEVHWLTLEQVRLLPDLLTSNRAFLEAWQAGAFSLPGESTDHH